MAQDDEDRGIFPELGVGTYEEFKVAMDAERSNGRRECAAGWLDR